MMGKREPWEVGGRKGESVQGAETTDAEDTASKGDVEAGGEGELGEDQVKQDLEVVVRREAFVPRVIGGWREVLSRQSYNLIHILRMPPWWPRADGLRKGKGGQNGR